MRAMATNKKPPRGWVLVDRNRGYISSIISNKHVDNPVVYYTDDLDEAKAFVVWHAVLARAEQLSLAIQEFVTDADGNRQIAEVRYEHLV